MGDLPLFKNINNRIGEFILKSSEIQEVLKDK